jgi:hypothetical protein
MHFRLLMLFAQKRKFYVSLIDSLARWQVDKFRTKFHADDEACGICEL